MEALRGYQFNRHFALEAGYVDFGRTTATGTVLGIPFSARARADAFEALAVGTLPLHERFALFGKAGLFRWDGDISATVAGVTVGAGDKDTDFTWGVGLKYSFAKNVAARLEFQRYDDLDVKLWSIGLQLRF